MIPLSGVCSDNDIWFFISHDNSWCEDRRGEIKLTECSTETWIVYEMHHICMRTSIELNLLFA